MAHEVGKMYDELGVIAGSPLGVNNDQHGMSFSALQKEVGLVLSEDDIDRDNDHIWRPGQVASTLDLHPQQFLPGTRIS